ncbi:MAG TPA: CopD family protein [Gaiellaceae bacterium]|nr:CopD family protein [Gaiellaceae bacterium]
MDQVAGQAWATTQELKRGRAPACRLLAVLVAAFALAAALAPAANAHSVLIATQPGNDVVVPVSPDTVVLEFNEGVDASLGSLRVYDGQGTQVDAGEVTQPATTEVEVGIGSQLAPGTYTVAWRVVSADSDPISGAFVFHVVERGVAGNVSIDALTGTSKAVDVLFPAGRFVDFALLLLTAGGSAVLVIALPTAPWRVRRRLYGILAAAAGGLAVVALVNILLQGATAGGLTLSDAFSWSLFTSVLETDFGEVMLIQSALAATLALTALALRHAEGHDRRRPLVALTLALSAGLTLTPSFAGHARTLGALGLTSDILHVISAALWTGGLASLVLALVLADADRWPLATRAVPRFSNLAVGSVVALLVAGTVSAYLQLRTWSALWDNTYGLLVLTKIVLVVPLLALGAYNNRYAVPRLKAGMASVLERRRFLRNVGTELGIMVVIIGVTAVLVNSEPARTMAMEMDTAGHPAMEADAMAPAEPFEGSVVLGDMEAMVAVDPATPGENTITITFMETAEPPSEVSVSASLPSQGIGPLDFTAEPDPAEQGSYVIQGASLSIAGDWELRIEALMGEFDLLTETITVPIQGG